MGVMMRVNVLLARTSGTCSLLILLAFPFKAALTSTFMVLEFGFFSCSRQEVSKGGERESKLHDS